MKKFNLLAVTAFLFSPVAIADVYMDASWAQKACDAWNQSPVLTQQLMATDEDDDGAGYSWVKNNEGRGYKLIQMYRTDCGADTRVQLTIAEKDGKAMCTKAGKPDAAQMNFKVDYLMNATDANWECMGNGSFGCGAMGAMMSGKLKFQGPKLEAMKVMGPFASFLQIAGKVPGEKGSCPAK